MLYYRPIASRTSLEFLSENTIKRDPALELPYAKEMMIYDGNLLAIWPKDKRQRFDEEVRQKIAKDRAYLRRLFDKEQKFRLKVEDALPRFKSQAYNGQFRDINLPELRDMVTDYTSLYFEHLLPQELMTKLLLKANNQSERQTSLDFASLCNSFTGKGISHTLVLEKLKAAECFLEYGTIDAKRFAKTIGYFFTWEVMPSSFEDPVFIAKEILSIVKDSGYNLARLVITGQDIKEQIRNTSWARQSVQNRVVKSYKPSEGISRQHFADLCSFTGMCTEWNENSRIYGSEYFYLSRKMMEHFGLDTMKSGMDDILTAQSKP
jgi:hypothetical protein